MIYKTTITLFSFFLAALSYFSLTHQYFEGDTIALIKGADSVVECLKMSVFWNCPDVCHFPLAQYIPAIILRGIGVSENSILTTFSFFSTISYIGIFGFSYLLFRKDHIRLLLVWLVLFTSPLLTYSKSTFNEVNASLITVVFVTTCILVSSRCLIILSFWLAGITKEPAFLPLALIGWVALGQSKSGAFSTVNKLVVISTGSVLAVATNMAFNYFRFGVPWNTINMDPIMHTTGMSQILANFLAIWFSPMAGLVTFWFTFVVMIVMWYYIAGGASIGCERSIHGLGNHVAIFAVILILTGGFAKWWSPYGWVCYGQRLILPWLPALVLLIANSTDGVVLQSSLLNFVNKWWTPLIVLLILLLSLPHLLCFVCIPPPWLYVFDFSYWGIHEHCDPSGWCLNLGGVDPRGPLPHHSDIYWNNFNKRVWSSDFLFWGVIKRSVINSYAAIWILCYFLLTALIAWALKMELLSRNTVMHDVVNHSSRK